MPNARQSGSRPTASFSYLESAGDAAIAILDRFLHHAEVITITGKSYRLPVGHAAKRDRTPSSLPRKPIR